MNKRYKIFCYDCFEWFDVEVELDSEGNPPESVTCPECGAVIPWEEARARDAEVEEKRMEELSQTKTSYTYYCNGCRNYSHLMVLDSVTAEDSIECPKCGSSDCHSKGKTQNLQNVDSQEIRRAQRSRGKIPSAMKEVLKKVQKAHPHHTMNKYSRKNV